MLKSTSRLILLLGLATFALSGCSSDKGNNNNNGGSSSLVFDKVVTAGNSISITFTDVGSTPFHCKFHSAMKGNLTVTAGGTPTTFNASIVNSTAAGFTPQNISVPVGSTVVWSNDDNVSHSVTSGN